MSETGPLEIQSHKGPYQVVFGDEGLAALRESAPAGTHYIVDARVAELYPDDLSGVLKAESLLLIEAVEASKSLERFPAYVEHLVGKRVRRGDSLIAVGGGITQDITAFLAATLLRGLDWRFYPTTLLAQADSCIGSKSSVNVGAAKNILGTFTPPRDIVLAPRFLGTLTDTDFRSGVGEMLKVHAIAGPESFDRIAGEYDRLKEPPVLLAALRRSLDIKKELIEADEFDRGVRNVMNYGHTFGHAIEAATDFAVPHGIAVTIGMDMANFASSRLGGSSRDFYDRMHPTLAANYRGFEGQAVPLEPFLNAIAKDKKNTRRELGLILPDKDGKISRRFVPNDESFRGLCADYFKQLPGGSVAAR